MSRQPKPPPTAESLAARKAGQSARGKARAAEQGMPKSTGRPLKAVTAEIDYKHVDLVAGGLARPGHEAKNVLKYGYASVYDHFVNGPADLPIAALARLWNLTPPTVQHWINRYDWVKARADRQSETPVLHGGTKPDDAVVLAREAYIERETEIVNLFLDDLEAALKEKDEDVMSPTGELKKRKKGALTRRTEAQTFKMIAEHARMALGLRTKPGIFEGASIDARSVTIINETRPAQKDTNAYLNETMNELIPPESEAVEAKIVE